jgi:hypothetical protein
MNRYARRRSLALVFALGVGLAAYGGAHAETQVVRVGPPPARMDLLKAGSHRYLRYEVKGGRRVAHDIWDRTIAFEQKDGRRLLHITQRWDEVNAAPGATTAIEQDSWFEPQSFRPLTHIRRVFVGPKVTVSGYAFLADKAVGLADLADNSRKDFALAYDETPFNFEYDMELIQTLPLRAGYAASIVFYDAGIDKKADRYTFKVAGSDRIEGWDGRSVDCWLVTADYNTRTVQSRWWVDKASQLVLREESRRDDGAMFIKTLLPPESADAAAARRD